MSQQPANVTAITQQIIEAGIAHRMLVESGQRHLPNDPSGCTFWVEVIEEGDEEMKDVIVKYPPEGRTQAFQADSGAAFGTAGQPPLSDSQQAVVDRLAEEWKRSQATT